jgi:hypothetical protein
MSEDLILQTRIAEVVGIYPSHRVPSPYKSERVHWPRVRKGKVVDGVVRINVCNNIVYSECVGCFPSITVAIKAFAEVLIKMKKIPFNICIRK